MMNTDGYSRVSYADMKLNWLKFVTDVKMSQMVGQSQNKTS